ncbi:MAG: DNA topoisomerase [Clostridiales bacterium]|nr:DNA topoisomerase [Candidatus Coliplasma caballi]
MAKKTEEYGNQSISMLKGADRVRKRPAVIFGSDGLEGCEHSFLEILANSIDEFREGYGKVINVTVTNDHVMTVEDFGRGVPLDWNEKEQRYNWELVFCELYAGGKYDNANSGLYEFSLGLNGLGACATQYSSEYMEVISRKGGVQYSIHFEKGEPIEQLQQTECQKNKTGTTIRWKSDKEVFSDIVIPQEFFTRTMKKQAVVNAGLTLNLKWQNADGSYEDFSYYYENGIQDYMSELIGETGMVPIQRYSCDRVGRDREDKEDYKLKIEFAFCFSNEVNLTEYYHNSSYLEYGGCPDKAARSAFVYAVDKYCSEKNKYSKNESKVNFDDVKNSLVLVVNSSSTQASYENQTKKAINNPFITKAMTEFFKQSLDAFFAENPAYADKVCQQMLINKRSRESAEQTRTNIKKKLTQPVDSFSNSVEKFVDCRSKDKNLCELYIVEGDSALTSCKLARNAMFQAIIPVRGKTLNCLKASADKIMKNDIILDLIKVIGCGMELKGLKAKDISTFDIDLLRWNKIIICTDADVDGYQIRTLILTLFYSLLPTLIREGRVYIAETPLYEINCKDETYFAYDEAEKNAILAQIGEQKYTIQRSKGLGENEADMMSRTTMHPATRRLIRVMPEDEEKTYQMFDVLLGDNLSGRKDMIAAYGSKYYDLADT